MKLSEAKKRVLNEARAVETVGLHRPGRFRAMCDELIAAGYLHKITPDSAEITPAGIAALEGE